MQALRELALRRTAQRVDAQMVDYMRAHRIDGAWPASERVLAVLGGKNYVSELGTRVVLRVFCLGSAGPWPGQRRSIAFSKGPPKTRMTRTRKAPSTTICHSADNAARVGAVALVDR